MRKDIEEKKTISCIINKRAYHLLDAVGTKPNVVYQVKVRNTKNNV